MQERECAKDVRLLCVHHQVILCRFLAKGQYIASIVYFFVYNYIHTCQFSRSEDVVIGTVLD